MSKEDLIAQYNNTGSQINNIYSQNQQIEESIRVLDSSHKQLKEIKSDMKDIKSKISSKDYTDDFWFGTRYDNDFTKVVNRQIVNGSVRNLIDDVDNKMSEINSKRASLQEQLDANDGFIGQLKGWLNQLAAEIENWVD